MTDEELSRALRGQEPPTNPEHRAQLEQELLAAYDSRTGHRARRRQSPWLRYVTAVMFLACLVTATQVTAEYRVEVGKRILLMIPSGTPPSPDLGEKMSRAFVAESSHVTDVKVMLRRASEGPATLVVDVWGDQLAQDHEGLERLHAMPELAGLSVDVTSLKGRVRDNLLGVLSHSLLRAGTSPQE